MWLKLVTSKLKLSLTSRLKCSCYCVKCRIREQGQEKTSSVVWLFWDNANRAGNFTLRHQERSVKLQLLTSAKSMENKMKIIKS